MPAVVIYERIGEDAEIYLVPDKRAIELARVCNNLIQNGDDLDDDQQAAMDELSCYLAGQNVDETLLDKNRDPAKKVDFSEGTLVVSGTVEIFRTGIVL